MSLPNSEKGWLWMCFHERDGWASHTKFQRVVAFAVSTFMVVWYTVKGNIPALMPEIMGVYLAYAVLGRASSKFIENKLKGKDDA